MALCWSVSSGSTSLLQWGVQSWTRHSRCSLTSAEQRQRTMSLHLLAVVFLMHSGRPWCLHCCPPEPPWHFLKGHIPGSQPVLEPEVIPPLGQDLVLPFVEYYQPDSPDCGVPLVCNTSISSVSPSPHICVTYRSDDKQVWAEKPGCLDLNHCMNMTLFPFSKCFKMFPSIMLLIWFYELILSMSSALSVGYYHTPCWGQILHLLSAQKSLNM